MDNAFPRLESSGCQLDIERKTKCYEPKIMKRKT